MRRARVLILLGVIIAIVIYVLPSGVHAACIAPIYARSNLRVATVTPASFRIRDNYAFIDLLIVLENVGDATVEIEWHLHELYLVKRGLMERYKLFEGKTYPIMDSGGIVIGSRSNRDLYLY